MNTFHKIEAYAVPEDARPGTLPRHFGQRMQSAETCIYDFMSHFAQDYSGGYWQFFELSNGGFYMRPPGEAYALHVHTNGYAGRMSADAAGVTVCLFAFSHLSFSSPGEVFTRHFHALREFALAHAEAAAILAAID